MKVIKTREFVYADPEVYLESRESISVVQTYRGHQMFYDNKHIEYGDEIYQAFLNNTVMSLEEAERVLEVKSNGLIGMGYTEVKE